MKIKRYTILFSVVLILLSAWTLSAKPVASNDAEVRNVVEQVFEQLKSGQYSELYDLLPLASRSRISRERFENMLQRTRDMYQLDRMEIGALRVSGDIATVDTVLYGRVLRPIETEGKIVAQQYLVREDGKWRVATGDRATVRRFLAANPRFAQKFPIRASRVYVKREGRWIDVTDSLRTLSQQRGR